jgi:hypothetical protein
LPAREHFFKSRLPLFFGSPVFQATKEEIKDALDQLALRHHPDKNRGESAQEAYELSLVRTFDARNWLFDACFAAQVRDVLLKDEVRRACYDLEQGFVADTEQEVGCPAVVLVCMLTLLVQRRRVHRMRRNVVMDTEETLASSAQSNREREAEIKGARAVHLLLCLVSPLTACTAPCVLCARSGLVIVEARYGNLDPATQTIGSYINVTDALQSLVSSSGLIIPPNLVKSV